MSTTTLPSREATAETPLLAALSALENHENDAARWLAVATEYRAINQPVQAIEACEACLKLDPRCVDGWVMIAELARAIGHHEFAEEAVDVIRQIAPTDPRIATL